MAASAAIFIGFGVPLPGRERQSIKVFNEVMQFYTRLQQQGEIESFEPALLEAHGGDLGGFILIRGERAKLDRVHASQEFQRMNVRGAAVVSNLGVVKAVIGEELNRQFGSYESDIGDLVG